MKIFFKYIFFFLLGGLSLSVPAVSLHAAVLTAEPSTGTFIVGSTFSVPIYVNTEGEAINAIEISAKFPPDKLQVISPSAGKSVITLWTEQPAYNNYTGNLSLQGLIVDGLTVGRGLVTTITFRVKAPGDAYIKFLGDTQILKHDGLGTDILKETKGAVYRLTLPPPAGPIVASETHPDPYSIYPNNSVFISWTPQDSVDSDYSYVLSREPIDTPDDIPDGRDTSIIYRTLSDGRYYFHIKEQRDGVWGGTTNFGINIDGTPPAEFPVEILPSTDVKQGSQAIARFTTTDAFSGIDHFEIKVVSLEPDFYNYDDSNKPFFVEATSPFLLFGLTNPGRYDVIARAFDKAGNYRDSTSRLRVVIPLLSMVGERGIEFGARILLPWWLIILLMTLFILILVVIGIEIRQEHTKVETRLKEGVLPQPIAKKKKDLEKKQGEHVKITQLVILALVFLPGLLLQQKVFAETVRLEPPIISEFSQNISNDEIFYSGGLSPLPNARVLLYIQNVTTGETILEETEASSQGEWFYRHNGFLSAGQYVLWAQAILGEEKSPPSPQQKLTVQRTAIQIGSTRLSLPFIFSILSLLLFVIILGQIAYILYHRKETRRKRLRWLKEVHEAEEAVYRGFAVLKRDIEAEVGTIRKIKLSGELRAEEVGREEQLMKDLAWVESSIQREVSDIEKEF